MNLSIVDQLLLECISSIQSHGRGPTYSCRWVKAYELISTLKIVCGGLVSQVWSSPEWGWMSREIVRQMARRSFLTKIILISHFLCGTVKSTRQYRHHQDALSLSMLLVIRGYRSHTSGTSIFSQWIRFRAHLLNHICQITTLYFCSFLHIWSSLATCS